MGRLYDADTILTNAFYAVRGVTTRLSDDDIRMFMRILQEEMTEVVAECPSDESSAVRFNFHVGDLPNPSLTGGELYEQAFGSYLALREGDDDDLMRANLCLGDDKAGRLALERARTRFAQLMRQGHEEHEVTELVSGEQPHRRVRPAEGVTFESVFADYEEKRDGRPTDEHDDNPQCDKAWLDGELTGAEREVWE